LDLFAFWVLIFRSFSLFSLLLLNSDLVIFIQITLSYKKDQSLKTCSYHQKSKKRVQNVKFGENFSTNDYFNHNHTKPKASIEKLLMVFFFICSSILEQD